MDQAAAPALAVIGEPIVPGRGAGKLLSASVGLSFWGGVDAVSGTVIDRHHPLCGESVAGKVLALPGFPNPNPSPNPNPNPNQVLAIPNGRGSCTGSQVVLELLLAGQAPAAILLRRPDQIIALGVIVAEELFGLSLSRKVRVRVRAWVRGLGIGLAIRPLARAAQAAEGPSPAGAWGSLRRDLALKDASGAPAD